MGEIKSVKVDNWGVFFLQKLQNFFNKTDYCDLTLQFRDNSQLKVHRLVLSACTDYFNVLEQTCEVIDDAIIMPNELQADVVVPIVNFMYTGTLEFELKMYNRLLRTAREMNMTVLLKLLEAHRRTMELHPPKAQGTSSPKLRRRVGQTYSGNTTQLKNVTNATAGSNVRLPTAPSSAVTVQRRIAPSSTNTNRMTQSASANTVSTMARQTTTAAANAVTYARIKQENIDANTNTANSVGYGGKSSSQQTPTGPSSTFEQLRKSYNNNKRPATATFISPPAKKPNLEDVKEFAEQQRMRKQIAAEYGDTDVDYDGALMDDDIHNDDDDDDISGNQISFHPNSTASNIHTSSSSTIQPTKIASAASTTTTSMINERSSTVDPPGTATITVKHEGPDKPPTIVVKDSSNSKMNHAKIISEVLRQYPHLIKSNKNIKLKIMPNTNLAGGASTSVTGNSTGISQKIIVKKDAASSNSGVENSMEKQLTKLQHHPPEHAVIKISPTTTAGRVTTAASITSTTISSTSTGTNTTNPIQKQQQQQRNASTMKIQQHVKLESNTVSVKAGLTTGATATTGGQQTQRRRIDSKTMHALIALGAENTTGPWLCLRCGRNGHPISIPSYRGFRRHLINTHKETIDPALCEYCGWRSSGKRELHFHMQLEHKVKTNLYIFPECQLCEQMCIDSDGLNQHLIESHPDENKQQCIYCNKIFPEEVQLYIHIKTYHKKQALDDGIIDYSDDEAEKQQEQQNLYHELMGEFISTNDRGSNNGSNLRANVVSGIQVEEDKIKILSDISLPSTSSIIKQEVNTIGNMTIKAAATKTAATALGSPSTTMKTIDGAEAYLHDADTETKFVTADGTEVILTDEQRKEILSQLNQEHEAGGVVMVLSEQQSEQMGAISHDDTSQATTETNEEPMEHDDSQIYQEMQSHSQKEIRTTLAAAAAAIKAPMDEDEDDDDEDENDDEEELDDESHELEQEEHATNEANEREDGLHRHRLYHHKNNPPMDENKESLDNLEWAENLISEHELADKAKATASSNKVPMDIDSSPNKDHLNDNNPQEAEDGTEGCQSLPNKKEREDVVSLRPDEISKKLKELTGDWSDDDIEEEMSAEEMMMDGGKKPEMIVDAEMKETTVALSPSPSTMITTRAAITTTTPITTTTAITKAKAIISTEGSIGNISVQLAKRGTEMLELVGAKADINFKDDKEIKEEKTSTVEGSSSETEKAKTENYDRNEEADVDTDEYDNNDIDDDDGDDDDEDDIDLALKSLHKGIEPESSSPIKDHNMSDELESLQVKLANKVTSMEEHHDIHQDNNTANDDVDNDNDNDERADGHNDGDDNGDVKKKTTTELSKRTISQKDVETSLKKNDLIEMLINDAEICADNTPITTAAIVGDNVATTATTITPTTPTTANVSTTLKSSPIGTIKTKKEEQLLSEAETEIETESELNSSDPTQSEMILEEKEEFVSGEAEVASSLLSANENKTQNVECADSDKNTPTKSSDGGDCDDSNVPISSSTATTEDRVKSLMSEWGEDDDDDDDDIDNDDDDDDIDDETKNL